MNFLLLWRRAGNVGSSRVVMEEFVIGDRARLVDSMRLTKELAASSTFFAKLSELFASDAAFRRSLEHVRGDGGERLRVVAYGLGGLQYSGRRGSVSPSFSSCATRFPRWSVPSRWLARP